MKHIFKQIFAITIIFTLGVPQLVNAQQRPVPRPLEAPQDSLWRTKLITSARSQIGVTTIYDGSYQRLDFPNGDVDRQRGVCTDVVIRAFRDAHGFDLQAKVNADMKSNFSAYPKNWGLKSTDRNIDHRRVPNLQTFFKRRGAELVVTDNAADYKPGDLVTWMLPGNLPHIGIISDRMNANSTRPLVLHNIGRGTEESDMLFAYKITGHYRPDSGKM